MVSLLVILLDRIGLDMWDCGLVCYNHLEQASRLNFYILLGRGSETIDSMESQIEYVRRDKQQYGAYKYLGMRVAA